MGDVKKRSKKEKEKKKRSKSRDRSLERSKRKKRDSSSSSDSSRSPSRDRGKRDRKRTSPSPKKEKKKVEKVKTKKKKDDTKTKRVKEEPKEKEEEKIVEVPQEEKDKRLERMRMWQEMKKKKEAGSTGVSLDTEVKAEPVEGSAEETMAVKEEDAVQNPVDQSEVNIDNKSPTVKQEHDEDVPMGEVNSNGSANGNGSENGTLHTDSVGPQFVLKKENKLKGKSKAFGFGLQAEEEDSKQQKRPLVRLDDEPEKPARPACFAALDEQLKKEEAKKQVKVVEEEVDPLDAFMNGLTNNMTEGERVALNGVDIEMSEKPEKPLGEERYFKDEEGALSEEDLDDIEDGPSWLDKQQQKGKGKELKSVDHSKIEYVPFRKHFYIEPKEIADMTPEEVEEYRKTTLEGVKIRGNCPKPIKKWVHCGLPNKVYAVLQKMEMKAPFPIQAQAMPAIMSGCDVIACAKTGSGKTLAFVLPMLRHIMDQPPLEAMDGPIGLIMAPTRELAVQIHNDTKKFAKPLDIRVACVYGGAGIAEQIADLKRGAEIVVCTPGRMIDLLCANQGRVTNLKRVTYCVLDEADRMFDMGFAPQIMTVIDNVRPDRQTVMFSATFPKSVETLAKKALKSSPIEIIIGGRSTASGDIKQIVEVREEGEKFRRLLELLGKWYSTGNILIFVDKQEMVDQLFRQLIDSGYPSLALHGGMDQTDREYTIADFKTKLRTIMVATSIVARGLDVKDLVLVINYTTPNHYEDYIHRVGRTGRAGKKGTAITFITPEEERFAPDLIKAMSLAKDQIIPLDLQQMADRHTEKRKTGEVKWGSNDGFGSGKGYKFDEAEDLEKKEIETALRAGYMPDDERANAAAEAAVQKQLEKEETKKAAQEEKKEKKRAEVEMKAVEDVKNETINSQLAAAKHAIMVAKGLVPPPAPGAPKDSGSAQAQEIARQISLKNALALIPKPGGGGTGGSVIGQIIKGALPGMKLPPGVNPSEYCALELEVNDYPQHARWKCTHKQSLAPICEMNEVSITTKGVYIPPGRKTQPGERKLYLLVEGKNEISVRQARNDLTRLLEEAALASKPEKDKYGKYSVLI